MEPRSVPGTSTGRREVDVLCVVAEETDDVDSVEEDMKGIDCVTCFHRSEEIGSGSNVAVGCGSFADPLRSGTREVWELESVADASRSAFASGFRGYSSSEP